MSLKIIELNDSGIRVGDDSGIIVQSPGFALAVGNTLEIGEAAEKQARLQPTNSYNKYWHELSLDPLSHSNNIRHFADIAYAHLLHLAEIGGINEDVIFAVPGNFTRQQLSILLGLAQQSPFNPVGVVDSALAASIAAAQAPTIIYADIQLHQVVLTRLQLVDQQLKTDSIVQVPGVGSQNFMDLMMQLATNLFIQQCRFNPQHNAQSEQQLYNELPSWLQQTNEDSGSLILELSAGDTVHTAKMPRESLVTNLGDYYQKINQQIAALATEADTRLLLSSSLAALPGFSTALNQYPDLLIVEPHSIHENCLEYRDLIMGESGIHLVSALPVAVSEAVTAQKSHEAEQATHALYGHRAMAIETAEKIQIVNQVANKPALNGSSCSAKTIIMNIDSLPEKLGHIEKRSDGIYLDSGEQQALLNQQSVKGVQKLTLGDSIQFAPGAEEISLIQVSNV